MFLNCYCIEIKILLNNVDSVVTHDVSHQEMNKEWCSYSKKTPRIQWNTLENS